MDQRTPNNFPLPGTRVWTPDIVARFKVLLEKDPMLSYTQIAEDLSAVFGIKLTKNSCIGFGRRIGVPKRQPPKRAARVFLKPKPRPYVPKQRLPKFIERPPQPKTPGRVSIMQLGPKDCRWPFGDRPPYFYCGHEKIDGHAYCREHAEISCPALRRA